MSGIDTRRAVARFESDRAMIEAAVRSSTGGFEHVNRRIHDCLRDWLTSAARELVARRVRLLGSSHEDTLASQSVLAQLLQEQGRTGEAIDIFRSVVRDLGCKKEGELQEDRRKHVLEALTHLARALISTGGKAEMGEATRIVRCVVTERCDTLGEDHADTISSKVDLAMTCRRRGNAEPLLRGALKRSIEVLGPTHTSTLSIKHTLADLLSSAMCTVVPVDPIAPMSEKQERAAAKRVKEAEEAVQLYHETLSCGAEIFGDSHPRMLATRHNLAFTLARLGELAKAAEVCADVLSRSRETLGDADPRTLQAAATMAECLLLSDTFEEAHKLHLHALATSRKGNGPTSPVTSAVLVSYEEFLKACMRVTGRRADATGAQSADHLLRMEDLEEATRLTRTTWLDCASSLGEMHPRTLTAHQVLLVVLDYSGNPDEAVREQYRAAVDAVAAKAAARRPRYNNYTGKEVVSDAESDECVDPDDMESEETARQRFRARTWRAGRQVYKLVERPEWVR